MNKKVPFAVLSSLAVTASFIAAPVAPAAAAAVEAANGFYFGGEADLFVPIADLANLSGEELNNLVESAGGIENIFVVIDNQYASIQEAIDANGDYYAVQKPVDAALFEGHEYVDQDGNLIPVPDLGEVAELNVENVSAINKTGVQVTFTATTDAKTGATVEVKDNTGAVKEVKALDLVKGETTATFEFVNPLGSEPTGVWTVNGVSTDLDLQDKLDAVYDAANQVALLTALQELGLTEVNADNIASYQAELTDLKVDVAKADFTKDLAQKVVSDGNVAALTAAQEETIVKAVNDAETQVALLSALQNAAFSRVNPDWIATYQADITAAPAADKDTVKEIQTLINAANVKGLTTLPAAGTSPVGKLTLSGEPSIVKADLEAAKTLVTAYQTPDAVGESAKADLLAKIDVQLAIVKVLEATTPAQLSSAITALGAVDAAFELNKDNFKDANRAAYIAKFTATTSATAKNTIVEIDGLLSTVNDAEAVAPATAIKTAGTFAKTATPTDAQAADLLKALKAYGDAKYVVDANAVEYAKLQGTTNNKFGELTIGTAAANKTAIQALVDEANLAAIQSATTADGVYAALVAYGNDVKDLSVNNKAQYLINKATYTTSKATVQAAVDASNITALQAQTTATGVLAKLNIITQLKDVNPAYSAAYLFEVTDAGGAIKAITIKTVANLQTAIDNVNTAQAATAGVKAVNDATTASALRDILTDLVVNGDITSASYLNLTSADKLLVADLFLNDDVFTASGLATGIRTNLDANNQYQALGDIGTDLETLSSAFDALRTGTNTVFSGINVGSVTIASVQAELAKLVKANYTAYDNLTGTQKLAAAEKFIVAFPVDKDGAKYLSGYTTFGAYTAAVDAAIAASK